MKKISLNVLSLLLVGVSTLVASQVLASNSSIDTSFKTGTPVGFDGIVKDMAIKADGKIVAVGMFNSYKGAAAIDIASINADGTKDPEFKNFEQYGSIINKVAVANDGKVIVAGSISIGGMSKTIGRLNSDRTVDTGFSAGRLDPQDSVYALVIQSDGKIIVGGNLSEYNGTTIKTIFRLNANGTIDSSFNIGSGFSGGYPTAVVNTIKIQSDGKIIIGGNFSTYQGSSANRIIRLNADGSRDTSFVVGDGIDSSNGTVVNTIEIQSDGKILVGGYFNTYQGFGAQRVVRINTDGSKDSSFNAEYLSLGTVYNSTIQSDDKIIICADVDGGYTAYRLNTDGSRDSSFDIKNGFGTGMPTKMISQSDGSIFMGGVFNVFNETPVGGILRVTTTGALDHSFNDGDGFNGIVFATAIQPDGKIIVGGGFKGYKGQMAQGIIRLNTNGDRDNSFNIGSGFDSVNGTIYNISLQDNGRIIVGGMFFSYKGNPVSELLRLMPDASIDPSFKSYGFTSDLDYGSNVKVTRVQSDGKILVGGYFNTYSGASANRIIRLNSDGTRDSSFVIGSGFDDNVQSIKIQSGGKILIGGNFTTYKGIPAKGIIRLNSDGSRDSSFDMGNGLVGQYGAANIEAIAIQSDGKIIIGGGFISYNGVYANNLIRLNSDGSRDTSFLNFPYIGEISSIIIESNGGFIIGGSFRTYTNFPPNRIIRLNSDGSEDVSFNGGFGFNDSVNFIVAQSGGKLLVGGFFTDYNGSPVGYLTSLYGDSAVVALPNSTNTTTVNDAFITQGYTQVSGTLVGATPISLSGTDGNIPVSLNLNNQNINLSLPGDTQFKQGENTKNYSGIISVPVVKTIDSVNNLSVIATFNVGSSSETITLVGGSAILGIPVPGQNIGDTVQIYYSPDNGVTWYFETTTQVIDHNGTPYVEFTTNHFGNFAVTGTPSSIQDTTAPIISLLGGSEITIQQNSTFIDPWVNATDNKDGDISSNVIFDGEVNPYILGTYIRTYNVSDAAGNPATQVTRTVHVGPIDTTAPVITLIGNATVNINQGTTYTDAGATALDNVDGNITANIVTSGSVDTAITGTYIITYAVSDIAGNIASPVTRTVNVNASTSGGSSNGGGGDSGSSNSSSNSSSSSSNLATSILNESLHGAALHEIGSIQNSPYSTELNNAYLWAFGYDITTMNSIQKANMEGKLIRKDMAKMISNFAINVLKKTPSTGTTCTFSDTKGLTEEAKSYISLSCKLGLMGFESNGTTVKKNFDPLSEVDRGQFGTILSRLLRGAKYNEGNPYYAKHLNTLKTAGIMTKITTPLQKEIRGYVMLMMQRASK